MLPQFCVLRNVALWAHNKDGMKSYEQFLDQSGQAIAVVASNGNMIFLNRAAEKLSGMKREVAIGKAFFDLFVNNRTSFVIERVVAFPVGYMLQLSPCEAMSDKHLMVHQLKTPLVAMKWSLEVLKNDPTLPIDKLMILGELYASNEAMIKLVNDILDVSNIENSLDDGARGIHNFERLFLEVIELFEPLAVQKGQKIVFEKHGAFGKIRTSQVLFKDALSNLLDNAIGYGADSSVITISATLDRLGKNYIISIHNFGIGIDKGERDKIFNKFYRSERAKLARPDGSGLGLYIAKLSAERNGGGIWFESGDGGTTFHFSVPNLV